MPFQYQEELIRKDSQIEIAGAGFQRPKGGKVNIAGIVFQHGGGQSMLTYLPEAEVLARAGAVSLILDAPGDAPGKSKPADERSIAT